MKHFVHNKGYAALAFLLFMFHGVSGRAELLIRFPAGVDPASVPSTTKQLERQIGFPVLGVMAAPNPDAAISPAVPKAAQDVLDRAENAYKELNLDEVLTCLEGAEDRCLREATFETCRTFLFKINMIRGMALLAKGGRDDEADQAFRSAHIAEPTRVLDPKQYPPNVMRRFARAWTGSGATVPCTLAAVPEETRFVLDGEIVRKNPVLLSPGRHFIEAGALGYASQYRLVEVSNRDETPQSLMFTLSPLADVVAWKTLVHAISDPRWLGGDGQIAALLNRFGIDHVLLLSFQENTPTLTASLAFPKRHGLQALPAMGRPGERVSPEFSAALRTALGIAPLPNEMAPPPPVTAAAIGDTDPEDEDDFDVTEDDELDEDEDPSVRFGETAPSSKDTGPSFSKVVKSPWLWISLGVVAAIVAGVVVSTQLDD